MSCYDAMAKGIGAEEYKPCEGQISWEDVEQSAKSASDFVLGVGAVAAGLHDAGRTSKEAGGEITEEQRKRVKCCTTIISSLVRCRNFRSVLRV